MPPSTPKTEIRSKADRARLRRIALAAQGLTQSAPFGRGVSGAQKMISHLGYVQIDTISVVERAHHHIFRSRVSNFRPEMTEHLLRKRVIFEYWAHAASFLPIEDYRYSLPYKAAVKAREKHVRSRDDKMMDEILAFIRSEGPQRSRDFEDPRETKTGWWDWKPAKRALEQLFMQGDLMVASRDGFEKYYDLTERVLPSDIDTSMPTDEEYARFIIDQQLRCHGFASLKGITYLRRDNRLRQAVKDQVEEDLRLGVLEEFVVHHERAERFICRPGLLDSKAPRTAHRLHILSPFDNSVIQRDRAKAIFDFDYQIECYVPEPKRQYGYFCLPLLYRDQFVGRMDCKAHRGDGTLELKHVHFCDHDFPADAVNDAFAAALPAFLDFQKCDQIKLTAVSPSASHDSLQNAIGE